MAISPADALVRTVNIAKLDVPTFESVEADESLTQESGAVVAVVSVLSALGALFSGRLWLFITSILIGLIGWFIWAWLSAFIAQKIFNVETTDTGEMLRVTGYAYGPQAIGVVPIIGPFLAFFGIIWSLVAVIIGMRQAAEMTTVQAIITALIGFLPAIIALGIVTSILR